MSPVELTAMAHEQMPFTELLGLEVLSGEPGLVEARGEWRAEYCTAGGMIHGGYLMAMADSVGALCAFLNLAQGSTTSTIESKTNFFRPHSSGVIAFAATPVHTGRSIVVVQTDATNEGGRLLSRTTQTQAVIAPG
jgi:1,4-dihydroxy-2-naphthoyl-CoA hydrolase